MLSNEILLILVASLFTLGLVVIVHELGHFLFCKLFGVFVKTFSIGIGPKLLRQRWGETEYVISAIPFGGYVKMAGEGMMEEIQDTGTWEERKYPLGTEEGNAEAAGMDDHIPPERHFYNRPAWQRFLVFMAGPLFNLILAFVIYMGVVLAYGLPTIPVTRVGAVDEGSPAAMAGLRVGDTITEVGGREVNAWGDVLRGLGPVDPTAETALPVPVTVLRDHSREVVEVTPVRTETEDGQWYWSVGLAPWNTTVGLVQKGGPAAKLGLKTGDEIRSVDGRAVTSFGDIATIINESPDRELEVVWERDGVEMRGLVTPRLTEIEPGVSRGRIFMEQYFAYESVSLGEAANIGYRNTLFMSRTMVEVLAGFFTGQQGLDTVGGPLRIGQAAGEQLRWGFQRLMNFIAFFSINLFLLNLLPIPVLDGGHVLFLLVEVVRGGKPVPERLQAIATQMGLIVLLLFMTFVFVLDVWKVTGH